MNSLFMATQKRFACQKTGFWVAGSVFMILTNIYIERVDCVYFNTYDNAVFIIILPFENLLSLLNYIVTEVYVLVFHWNIG